MNKRILCERLQEKTNIDFKVTCLPDIVFFKGLNYGIDFKGGTLIELRSNNIEASSIRDVLKNMNLGDINVKKFVQDGEYLSLINI